MSYTPTTVKCIFQIQQLTTSASTPQLPPTPVDLDSPSSIHTGHQSEDDGYMSMNGRSKQLPGGHFKPLREQHEDFPPPPEEAQRVIAQLLPK